MAWIESHQQIRHHPKTLDLMNLMKWNFPTTIGTLHLFWWWCIDYAPDGDLRRHNASRLGAAVGLSDEQAERFVSAMIQARWLDTMPYFRVHDWWEYFGPFLQTKHKRHPEVWQRVRDLYQGKCSTDDKGQLLPYSTSTPAQNDTCSAVQTEQANPCSAGTTERNDGCSTSQPDQVHRSCTDINEQNERYSTSENLQTQQYCAVPPNQPNLTVPNKTNQQQQQPADFQSCQHSENPGRHQQQPPPIPPLVAGTVADAVGLGDCSYRPPVCASPENDLRRILYDRIGRKVRLSLLDLNKIIKLKNKHGPDFFNACDFLHGGVKNPAAFLLAILEPESETEKLAERLRKRALAQDTKSKEHPDQEHD